jgi:hypothetical protein
MKWDWKAPVGFYVLNVRSSSTGQKSEPNASGLQCSCHDLEHGCTGEELDLDKNLGRRNVLPTVNTP